MRKKLDYMPFAKAFETEEGNEELCNSTGYVVEFEEFPGIWWNEYEDSEGRIYYGR